MRVLLVRPRVLNAITVFGALDCEPLELEYLAAACRAAGHLVQIYDGVVTYQPFTQAVAAFLPGVVAVTGYLTQEREMEAYVRLAKRVCPHCVTVIGGVHAQLCWRRLTFQGVDFLYRSESTAGFTALLSALEEHRPPTGIPGLCWRQGDGWAMEPYQPCDIDTLPLPDRSGWADSAHWFHYFDWLSLSTMKTSVSCPYPCTFCYGRHLHGGRYQARDLSLVLDELEAVPGETVFFVDSDFLLEEDRIRAFLAGVRDRGIHKRYLCYARADFIAAHPALMAALKEAGFVALLVGLEAADSTRLEEWDKGTTQAVNQTCVQVLRDSGLDCIALMIADPGFTRGEFQQLYRWVKRMGLRYVSVQILTPLPATPYYDQQAQALTTTDFSQFDLNHLVVAPTHMTRRQFLRRHRWTLFRLFLLGWRRGAYRFVTPRYGLRVLIRWFRRSRTLS